MTPAAAPGAGAPERGPGTGAVLTLGVAVTVPEPYGSAVQDARAGLGDPQARAIPTHVTLLPPTELAAEQLDRVRAHLAAVAAAHRPFRMLLHGSGSFRPVSPVVFVRVEEGAQECRELEAAIRSGPLARELAFPYHPHVTVAHGLPEPVLDLAAEQAREFHAAFTVSGFTLSRFDRDEVWRPWETFEFAEPRK
ncbi:2'-5' RNA ligase [Streptomyces tateyamensis]|uniref:2'-5' RNA ligase n=1 Tax=Streptomyces tateyamensis TaxID=565073 RepID=A0A2V4N599_9ACTN|nr:2'-5' RNA ligase family protein [Streptomyces tateyamensis]PYC78114.1 2'-5' RNA ligase [Streptomyces tateyamensis]